MIILQNLTQKNKDQKQKMFITSAYELDRKTVDKIKNEFQFKGEVQLEIEQSLLGGVKVRFGNNLYDGSVRHQLDKLRDKIYNSF